MIFFPKCFTRAWYGKLRGIHLSGLICDEKIIREQKRRLKIECAERMATLVTCSRAKIETMIWHIPTYFTRAWYGKFWTIGIIDSNLSKKIFKYRYRRLNADIHSFSTPPPRNSTRISISTIPRNLISIIKINPISIIEKILQITWQYWNIIEAWTALTLNGDN